MAQKKKSTSVWVWLFLTLILAAFVAFVLFLDQKVIENGLRDDQQQKPAPSKNKPTIDFYSVLPQRKVEIPLDEEDREDIDNPSINKQAVDKSFLQVGSFHSSGEADSRKAQLAFLGLEATVESAVVGDKTWHRVQLGPFSSQTQLSRAKNLLIGNDIKYMQRNAP